MTPDETKQARALVERLTGFTPGPWREWDGMIQNQSDWIDQNGTRHTDWNFPGIITEMPDTWESRANGYLIADAPDLHRHLTAALAEIERLREENRKATEKMADLTESLSLALAQINLLKNQRCAECDCESGGADCNWIVPSRYSSQETDQ